MASAVYEGGGSARSSKSRKVCLSMAPAVCRPRIVVCNSSIMRLRMAKLLQFSACERAVQGCCIQAEQRLGKQFEQLQFFVADVVTLILFEAIQEEQRAG